MIPLSDVAGNAIALPEQTGAIGLKVGITFAGFTVIVIEDVPAHCPVAGVKR